MDAIGRNSAGAQAMRRILGEARGGVARVERAGVSARAPKLRRKLRILAMVGLALIAGGCATDDWLAPTSQPTPTAKPVRPNPTEPPQVVEGGAPTLVHEATIPVTVAEAGAAGGAVEAGGKSDPIQQFLARIEAADKAGSTKSHTDGLKPSGGEIEAGDAQPAARLAADAVIDQQQRNNTARAARAGGASTGDEAAHFERSGAERSPVVGILRSPDAARPSGGREASPQARAGAAGKPPLSGSAASERAKPNAAQGAASTGSETADTTVAQSGGDTASRAAAPSGGAPRIQSIEAVIPVADVARAASATVASDGESGGRSATTPLRSAGTTALNAPLIARGGPQSLQDFLASQPPLPGNETFKSQLDQRILWLLAGEDEKAERPLTQVPAEQVELARRYLSSLRTIRDGHMGDLSGAASRVARELDQLRTQIGGLSELNIPTLALCRAVRGYGQYEPIEPARFVAGRGVEFVVYCEVRDFASEQRGDGQHHLHFDLVTAVLDESGRARLELKDPNITDKSRNRRQDCFLPRLVSLPADLPAGRYVVKATLTDRIGRKMTERTTAFEVVGGE